VKGPPVASENLT